MFRALFFLSFLVASSVVLAEEPARGTLPDGRAFRVDNNGNQLVDYIAELEVNVDALEKRIYGLQDELKEKNAALERVQGGGSACPKLEERDLLAKASQACPSCPTCRDCSQEITSSGISISKLQNELLREQELHKQDVADYRAALSQVEQPGKECLSKLSDSNRKLNECDRRLEAGEADYKAEAAKLQSQLATLKQQISELSSARDVALKDKDNQAQALNAKIRSLEEQNRSTSTVMASLKANSENRPLSNSIYKAAPQLSSSSLPYSAARERAVENIRSDLSAELTRVRMNISNRDHLFAQYDQKGKTVQFKPSPAVSSRKLTISQVSEGLASASSVKQLAEYRRDIDEISRKVNDDIALIRRISKKG